MCIRDRFQAEVTRDLCGGSARRAERRFGWRRTTITKGLRELDHGFECVGNFAARARPRWEDKNPQFAQDVRDLVEPRSQTHPELKLERCYTNMSAGEVLELLQTQKGYQKANGTSRFRRGNMCAREAPLQSCWRKNLRTNLGEGGLLALDVPQWAFLAFPARESNARKAHAIVDPVADTGHIYPPDSLLRLSLIHI